MKIQISIWASSILIFSGCLPQMGRGIVLKASTAQLNEAPAPSPTVGVLPLNANTLSLAQPANSVAFVSRIPSGLMTSFPKSPLNQGFHRTEIRFIGNTVAVPSQIGLLVSNTGGVPWIVRDTRNGLHSNVTKDVVQIGNRLLVANENQVAVSLDGGVTFSPVPSSVGLISELGTQNNSTFAQFAATSKGVFLPYGRGATAFQGIWTSKDAGVTGSVILRTDMTGVGNASPMRIITVGDRLFGLFTVPGGITFGFSDDGVAWTLNNQVLPVAPSFQGFRLASLGQKVAAVKGSQVFTSSDGGKTFSPGVTVPVLNPTDEMLDIALTETKVLVGGYGISGIWASSDFGATFVNIPAPDQVQRVAYNSDKSTLFVGGTNSFYRSTDGGVSYTSDQNDLTYLTSPGGSIVAIDPAFPGRIATYSFGGAVFFSTDMGKSFAYQRSIVPGTPLVNACTTSSSAAGAVFVKSDGVNDIPITPGMVSMMVCPTTYKGRVFVGTNLGLAVSLGNGTYRIRDDALGVSERMVTSIAADADGLYFSTQLGTYKLINDAAF